ncbi:MAG TPA: S41 family peptidase [Bryobacteraceae bacterium]|nr:S41 family peptidase [Bryobacteraceae bacterium]
MWKQLAVGVIIAAGSLYAPAPAQNQFDNIQRERARQMLRDLRDAMQHHYYDPQYHGIDLEARFKAADTKLQTVTNLGDALIAIAQTLDALKDSHTFFLPPSRNTHREYGYVLQMIGDRCFITAVRPNRDATEKLAVGDEVLTWQNFTPKRDTLWTMNYIFNGLLSLPVMNFVVRGPDGAPRKVEVSPKVTREKQILDLNDNNDFWKLVRDEENDEHDNRQRLAEFGDALLIWKMPEFDLTDEEADRLAMKEARKYQTLVVDLRGNPGGYVKTLERMVGDVMDHEVTIATRTGRKDDLKPEIAKSRGANAFSGKLIVLIDSRSASAAELFARVVQIEHRGTVIGDHSSGSVMESRHYQFHQGADVQIFYGASITEADLIMGDGKSLEHTGVAPDELILPTPADLAAGRDPVLARAAKIAGVELDPVKAGKLFPIEWRKD